LPNVTIWIEYGIIMRNRVVSNIQGPLLKASLQMDRFIFGREVSAIHSVVCGTLGTIGELNLQPKVDELAGISTTEWFDGP
jgi:hypothetical protein